MGNALWAEKKMTKNNFLCKFFFLSNQFRSLTQYTFFLVKQDFTCEFFTRLLISILTFYVNITNPTTRPIFSIVLVFLYLSCVSFSPLCLCPLEGKLLATAQVLDTVCAVILMSESEENCILIINSEV